MQPLVLPDLVLPLYGSTSHVVFSGLLFGVENRPGVDEIRGH